MEETIQERQRQDDGT
jgi:hypothetical protein